MEKEFFNKIKRLVVLKRLILRMLIATTTDDTLKNFFLFFRENKA